MKKYRTGLAAEARSLCPGKVPGVRSEGERLSCGELNRVFVESDNAARRLGKPRGTYITLDLGGDDTEPRVLRSAARALSAELSALLPREGTVLVVGLGNRDITCDAVGPRTAERVIVTAHIALRHGLRPVCAMAPGVMGTTGMDTSELVSAVCARLKPAAVIAADALAAVSPERLCRSFQISDAGIVPGDGADGGRKPLNRQTAGVPVIAFGVPTVAFPDAFGGEGELLLTPSDIDLKVRRCGRLMAWAVNMALHGDMSEQEMNALLGV